MSCQHADTNAITVSRTIVALGFQLVVDDRDVH